MTRCRSETNQVKPTEHAGTGAGALGVGQPGEALPPARAGAGYPGTHSIETAPRDGTHIIGSDGRGWREMWFKRDQYEGEYWTDHGDTEPAPTHWIPVPRNAN